MPDTEMRDPSGLLGSLRLKGKALLSATHEKWPEKAQTLKSLSSWATVNGDIDQGLKESMGLI